MKYLSYILYSLMLISCGGQNMQKHLKEITAEVVVVPQNMSQMINGRDSVTLDFAVENARLVVWVDSVACSSCRLSRMYEYDEVIDFSEETGGGFAPIFVFSPPLAKLEEVLLTLRQSHFDYPVFIDDHGVFSTANPHIPADSRFHTFLLDKNGKVVVVGDPVNNPDLWELYKTTITKLLENGGVIPEE